MAKPLKEKIAVIKDAWGKWAVVLKKSGYNISLAQFNSKSDAVNYAARTTAKTVSKTRAKAIRRFGTLQNPSVRTAPKSAIPAKFVTAKVRRVGGKVQILLNK